MFSLCIKDFMDLDIVMRSGQVFSIDKVGDGIFKVLSADKCCIVYEIDNHYEIECPIEDEEYWKNYFNVSTGRKLQDVMYDENKFLSDCAKYSKGMVILRQDLWETVVSFIISQRKSIPAIKTSLNRIREKFGKEKRLGSIYRSDLLANHLSYKTFPTAEDMKDITLEDLAGMGLGYRGLYVIEAIKWWNGNYSNYADILRTGTREDHIEVLKQIKGIGDKVANCICLFALSDINSFPIDVWIQRALDKELFSIDDIDKYGDYRGMVQQVIFFYVIDHKELFRR